MASLNAPAEPHWEVAKCAPSLDLIQDPRTIASPFSHSRQAYPLLWPLIVLY